MPGNTFGALKAKLTRHYQDDLKFWQELDRDRKRSEVLSNIAIWEITRDYLREIDPDFDFFWDNCIPDYLWWRGDKFQEQLKMLWDRISQVKNNNL